MQLCAKPNLAINMRAEKGMSGKESCLRSVRRDQENVSAGASPIWAIAAESCPRVLFLACTNDISLERLVFR